jgi:hypothetical protein
MDTNKMDTNKMDTNKMDTNKMDTNKMNTTTKSSTEIKNLIDNYISQLNDIEKKVLTIAKEHLETSFSIEKSIGFKQWLKTNQ